MNKWKTWRRTENIYIYTYIHIYIWLYMYMYYNCDKWDQWQIVKGEFDGCRRSEDWDRQMFSVFRQFPAILRTFLGDDFTWQHGCPWLRFRIHEAYTIVGSPECRRHCSDSGLYCLWAGICGAFPVSTHLVEMEKYKTHRKKPMGKPGNTI